MQRYIVAPKGEQPYHRPTEGNTEAYAVWDSDGNLTEIEVTIQMVIDNWSPEGGIRIEGYTHTTEGARGVIGYYNLASVARLLGVIEVQDT